MRNATQLQRPKILLICYYDPAGIPTVQQTIHHMIAGSRYDITLLNLFEQINVGENLALNSATDFDAYAAIIIHNTVSYNPYNLRALDLRTKRKLKDYRGVKILMKQDENNMMRQLAEYIGETGFDVIFTCLPDKDIAKVYPPHIAGSPRYERMLTGYVTPELREQVWKNADRPIDIGYRGSIQPLSFGRLAYEKRAIGNDVSRLLQKSDLRLDISSRREDRIGGEAWFNFMRQCKAVLGSESGASVFNLGGELELRCAQAEKKLGKEQEDAEYAEAYLAHFADLEGNVDYAQISPRHFEAAACGAIQLLHPGNYSGALKPHKHYFPLARDYSNLQEAVALLVDEAQRSAMAEAAHRDVIMNSAYWIETFVSRFDHILTEALDAKSAESAHVCRSRHRVRLSRRMIFQLLLRIWVHMPYSWQQRLKPAAKRMLIWYYAFKTKYSRN